jgi:hypothetical protein
MFTSARPSQSRGTSSTGCKGVCFRSFRLRECGSNYSMVIQRRGGYRVIRAASTSPTSVAVQGVWGPTLGLTMVHFLVEHG